MFQYLNKHEPLYTPISIMINGDIKMVRKATPQFFWEAEATIKTLATPGIAFAVQTKERKEAIKGSKFYEFSFEEWTDGNGKIEFDVGKRLRGWMKTTAKTVRPSLGDVMQYGLRCLSMPTIGAIEIADVKELEGMKGEPDADLVRGYRLPEKSDLPYPKKEAFVVGSGKDMRSVFSFHYVLPVEKELQVKIISFARNFTPEMARWMLTKFGKVQGLGDRYAQGFGLFELVDFEFETEEIPL